MTGAGSPRSLVTGRFVLMLYVLLGLPFSFSFHLSIPTPFLAFTYIHILITDISQSFLSHRLRVSLCLYFLCTFTYSWHYCSIVYLRQVCYIVLIQSFLSHRLRYCLSTSGYGPPPRLNLTSRSERTHTNITVTFNKAHT